LTHRTADIWADFEQRVIGMAINKWQNNSGAVSVANGSIIPVVTVDTAKHFIISIKTLFNIFIFSVHKAA